MPVYKVECYSCMNETTGSLWQVDNIKFQDCKYCGSEICPNCEHEHKDCREALQRMDEEDNE